MMNNDSNTVKKYKEMIETIESLNFHLFEEFLYYLQNNYNFINIDWEKFDNGDNEISKDISSTVESRSDIR